MFIYVLLLQLYTMIQIIKIKLYQISIRLSKFMSGSDYEYNYQRKVIRSFIFGSKTNCWVKVN